MKVRELQNAMQSAQTVAPGVAAASLYPAETEANALLAVDIWELQQDASLNVGASPEEQFLLVIDGEGRLSGDGDAGARVTVRRNVTLHLLSGERYVLTNTGREVLRVHVTTPLLVRSSRAAGISAGGRLQGSDDARESQSQGAVVPNRTEGVQHAIAEAPPPPENESQPTEPVPTVSSVAPVPIESMMRRASELKGQPRPERRRPPQSEEEPEIAQQSANADAEGEAEAEDEEASTLMELVVAFDAGTRGAPGSPGEGFGRYMVQAPGRKPAVRRVELGDDIKPMQAEYRVLVECLSYVIERLKSTGRTPDGVQLDIRSAEESLVNQLTGTMKVRDQAIRRDHAQTVSLLEQFAEWSIEWQEAAEITRLFE